MYEVETVHSWVRHLVEWSSPRAGRSRLVPEPAMRQGRHGLEISPLGIFFLRSPNWSVKTGEDGAFEFFNVKTFRTVSAEATDLHLAREAGLPMRLVRRVREAVRDGADAREAHFIIAAWLREQGADGEDVPATGT